MAKYGAYGRRPPLPPRPWDIHPVWYGIGCFLTIVIPIMAYASAVLLIQENFQQGWLPIPKELTRTVILPWVGSIPYLFANLILSLLLTIFGFVLLTVVYSLIYQFIGPPRLGPLDSPPIRGRLKLGK